MSTPHYSDESVTLHHGDCLDVLRELPDGSVDAVVCDPPYGLSDTTQAQIIEALTRWLSGDRTWVPEGRGFMGKAWDNFMPPPAVWDECFRALKPGGHLLSFAGPRTQDLMGVSIRLAGFEVRDSIAWLYSTGFPKSRNVLKPAFEPIVVGRKPLAGTVAANVLDHGTGALNIDGCRTPGSVPQFTRGVSSAPSSYSVGSAPCLSQPHAAGRWPTNVVLDESQVAELDRQTGTSTSRVGKPRGADAGAGWGMTATGTEYDDSGGASRFFPTFRYEPKAPTSERPRVNGVAHETVKPLDLMRWLVRLVTPPGGVVVDPFAGSGTTAEACVLEGLRCIAIEREADYLPLIVQRLAKPLQPGLDLGGIA